jgi:hypothetical protein
MSCLFCFSFSQTLFAVINVKACQEKLLQTRNSMAQNSPGVTKRVLTKIINNNIFQEA